MHYSIGAGYKCDLGFVSCPCLQLMNVFIIFLSLMRMLPLRIASPRAKRSQAIGIHLIIVDNTLNLRFMATHSIKFAAAVAQIAPTYAIRCVASITSHEYIHARDILFH